MLVTRFNKNFRKRKFFFKTLRANSADVAHSRCSAGGPSRPPPPAQRKSRSPPTRSPSRRALCSGPVGSLLRSAQSPLTSSLRSPATRGRRRRATLPRRALRKTRACPKMSHGIKRDRFSRDRSVVSCGHCFAALNRGRANSQKCWDADFFLEFSALPPKILRKKTALTLKNVGTRIFLAIFGVFRVRPAEKKPG